MGMRIKIAVLFVVVLLPLFAFKFFEPSSLDTLFIVKIDAQTKEKRTQISGLGIAIEEVSNDYVVGFCHREQLADLRNLGFTFQSKSMTQYILDFPPADSDFHNYGELKTDLEKLAATHPEIAELSSIGKSVLNRELYVMRISSPQKKIKESKPGIIFMGLHHAREHLSAEIALALIRHLLENYGVDEKMTNLIDKREIFVLPMVNPDGAEFDIRGDSPYKWWRKNRQGKDSPRVYGVDLNRNYGHRWGGQGSSANPISETYRGPYAFSEPETQVVKSFIEAHKNLKILLSYHAFGELVLFPWGHTYDSIEDETDLRVHQTLAAQVAAMTGYTAQQSSDLYITSGDTTDWSYGAEGIISFTIELYPGSMQGGGFYPPATKIQQVIDNNIPAALYLIEVAGNPRRVVN